MVIINERKDGKLRYFTLPLYDSYVAKGVADKGDKNYSVIIYNKDNLFDLLDGFYVSRKKVEKKAKIVKEK